MWPDNDRNNNTQPSVQKGQTYKHRAADNFFVVVIDVVDTCVYFFENGKDKKVNVTLVHYRSKNELFTDEIHTFSKTYIHHEPVYEYKYAIKIICSNKDGYNWEMSSHYYTEREAPEAIDAEYKKLEFTKRERKCQ